MYTCEAAVTGGLRGHLQNERTQDMQLAEADKHLVGKRRLLLECFMDFLLRRMARVKTLSRRAAGRSLTCGAGFLMVNVECGRKAKKRRCRRNQVTPLAFFLSNFFPLFPSFEMNGRSVPSFLFSAADRGKAKPKRLKDSSLWDRHPSEAGSHRLTKSKHNGLVLLRVLCLKAKPWHSQM